METNHVAFDFSRKVGPIKPMHAVNNGPVYKFAADQRITNIVEYKAAGIPYARIHDASHCNTYGGPHAVDVAAIFPDFDADENDPASYDFVCTDNYLRVIEYAGTECYYRLGASIEHFPKKYNTLPPKDAAKWARICEHIIRHYTEGWADGYRMKITYWEIWNEPELDLDSPNKRCWGGTAEQFYELFRMTVNHLKKCFPHLKIGGPASAAPWREGFAEHLFEGLDQPLDFYSWHNYNNSPDDLVRTVRTVREKLDALGARSTESILNEWNYVEGWVGEPWEYSLRCERGLKGSAFTGAVMALCQSAPLDLLMYYDARPCGMNGLFEAYTNRPLKGYFPFRMFNRLYRLGTQIASENGEDLYAVGAANGEGEGAFMISHFNNDDRTSGKSVRVCVKGAPLGGRGVRTEYFIVDDYRSESPFAEFEHDTTDFEDEIFMPLFSTVLCRVTKI